MRLMPWVWLLLLWDLASVAKGDFQKRVQSILEGQAVQQGQAPSTGALQVRSPQAAPSPQAGTGTGAGAETGTLTPILKLQSYTPAAMVDLIAANPDFTHAQYAAHFGRTPGWFASVLASESFQIELADRKGEIPDPAITATMEERLKALAMRSLSVLQSKLDSPNVSDQTILAAAQLGVKGLGLGNAVPVLAAPVTVATGAEAVADRIMEAMAKAKARVNGGAVDVEVKVKEA